MISKLASTTALGFGAGLGAGFLAASMSDFYQLQPVARSAEIQKRVEIVAIATGLVGATIFITSSGMARTFAGALVASSAFSYGLIVHSTLQAPP